MIKTTTNIREIAKIAGVSVASVSRALKSEPSSKLSEKQRRHILEICAKLQNKIYDSIKHMSEYAPDVIDIKVTGFLF